VPAREVSRPKQCDEIDIEGSIALRAAGLELSRSASIRLDHLGLPGLVRRRGEVCG
jgi:hypothetical protein